MKEAVHRVQGHVFRLYMHQKISPGDMASINTQLNKILKAIDKK